MFQTNIVKATSHHINSLNNSDSNTHKHIGNNKHWRQSNFQKQYLEATSEDVSFKRRPRKTIVAAARFSARFNHVTTCLFCSLSSRLSRLLSSRRTAVVAYLTSALCLTATYVCFKEINPADGRGSAWKAFSGALSRKLGHTRYLSPNPRQNEYSDTWLVPIALLKILL